MTDISYLQPVGLLYGEPARQAVADGVAGALAGGSIGFSSVRIIGRQATAARTEVRNFSDLNQSLEPTVRDGLERLTRDRSAVAGLTMQAPRIMGVVNVTPDSFSDGGLYDKTDRAIAQAAQLMAEGADIVDIGGESTRPGADEVDPEDEIKRVIPVIEGLKGSQAKLSIDTRKAKVMARARDAGVHIINDVSALAFDAKSLEIAADSKLPVILMHARGSPKVMQDKPVYQDVLLDVYDYLSSRIEACNAAGITHDRIVVDPGIGFGKGLEHNLSLISDLSLFHGLGVPLMLGASRKSFIGALTGVEDPRKREPGSLAAALAGMAQGAHIIRVHQVSEMIQARTVWQAIASGKK